ncbi:MAG: hypothetical protein U0353_25745 [Sandaracinus sp.]
MSAETIEEVADRSLASGARGMLALDGSDVENGRRLLVGLALSWVFGLGIALATGRWTASLGVPALLALVGSVGVPSVVIGLVLARTELDARDAARAAVHGIATTGLLLGGLTPATVLYVAGTTDPTIRFWVSSVVLAAAGALGLVRMAHTLLTRAQAPGIRVAAIGIVAAFAVFSAALGARVWSGVGPTLTASEVTP